MELPLPVHAQRRTAHELVRETLRRAILDGVLSGGTRLVQAEIAAQLQVSTTPVREALRDLATEGLIRLDAHRGAIVYQPDLTDLRELYDLREILEAEAVRRAVAHITPAELDEAQELCARMEHETDSGAWVKLNQRFHAVLAGAARSARMTAVLDGLRDASTVYVALSFTDARLRHAADDEHAQLLAALRAGDAEHAATLVVDHLQATLRAVEAAQRGTGLPVTDATGDANGAPPNGRDVPTSTVG